MQQLETALLEAARERGYQIGQAFGARHCFVIHGERVEWLLYERSAQRKVPLTKKELKSGQFADRAEKGWKPVYLLCGWMMLVVKVDYRSDIRIAERPRHRFKVEEILGRFEALAVEAAAEKKRRDEEDRRARRRAAERVKSRRVEDGRWNAMHDMMKEAEHAQRLRRFIDIIATHTPLRPDQERRVRKFVRWANAHADAIDPMSRNFDGVLARLGMPKP